MKPRIFINMHYMELGGAERSLLGLLNALDTERLEVSLFLNQHTGEFMPLIPEKVRLLPEKRGYNAIEQPLKKVLKEGQLGVLFGRLWARRQHAKYHETLTDYSKRMDNSVYQYIANAVQPFLPRLDDFGVYDLAISFLPPHNIVLNKVKAKKKLAWIHTDYSTIHVNTSLELPIWSSYDYIASISPECTNSFIKAFPSLRNKIIEIENILSPDFVRDQAELSDVKNEMPATGMRLLSVGRYTTAKNYDNVPDIARRIIQAGYPDLRWYIIGYGGDEGLIRRKIDEAKMKDHVILLGKKDNPYPYIKECDIYVQPSRFEGKSVTVREAQILCKPVIVTNYPTAKSQINDGIDGLIVPMDNEGCSRGIIDAINKKEMLDSFSAYLTTHDYGNEGEVEKLYNIINERSII